MEKLVADQHNQGEETQLEVAERVESTNAISDSCVYIKYFFERKIVVFISHSLQLCWRLGLISADDEQREEDGEQAATT